MNRRLGIALMSTILLTGAVLPNVALSAPRNSEGTARPIKANTLNTRNRTQSIVSSQETLIPRGTRITVQHDKDKVVVAPAERLPLTLTIRDNVVRNNRVVIPAGTRIEGELRPAGDGSRFVARTLVFRDGQRSAIDARSQIVSRRETVRQNPKLGRVLTGAGIGAAAAAIIAGITGDRKIDAIEVLGGAAVGGAGSFALGKQQAEVISIRPNEDLTLELRSDLAFR